MLKDLKELAENSREVYQTKFVNNEFKLSREFKDKLMEVLNRDGSSISYSKYTAEITNPGGIKIFCPNQWFYIATFAVEFVSELMNYKNVYFQLMNSDIEGLSRGDFKNKIIELKKGKELDSYAPEIKEAVFRHFAEDTNSAEFFLNFITDYSWWHGSKTIDRNDFYHSPTLSLLQLINDSQGYVAKIVYYLVSDPQLMEYALNLQEQVIETGRESLIPGENLIVYGAPGTGKSRYLEDNFTDANRIVFHSEYTYFDFVGSYKPVPLYELKDDLNISGINGESFDKGRPIIDYQFVPGPFIEVLKRSIEKPDESHTLLIEEINRANAPAVFGDVFQLLDRSKNGQSEYTIKPNPDLHNYLISLPKIGRYFREGLYIPKNMNVVSTMNSADQGVYVLDSAFKRRWKFKYMQILETGFIHENSIIAYAETEFKWKHFLTAINRKLKSIKINEDKLIGPYFISPEEIQDPENISSKLLIYLWDDVLRYKRPDFFDQSISTFSELVMKFRNKEDALNILTDLNQLVEEEEDLILSHDIEVIEETSK